MERSGRSLHCRYGDGGAVHHCFHNQIRSVVPLSESMLEWNAHVACSVAGWLRKSSGKAGSLLHSLCGLPGRALCACRGGFSVVVVVVAGSAGKASMGTSTPTHKQAPTGHSLRETKRWRERVKDATGHITFGIANRREKKNV